MNIHEYQAKELLNTYNVPVLKNGIVDELGQVETIAQELGGPVWVVKAQIHAGGRGQGGGVKVAHSLEDAKEHARNILGMTLVTHQTGPDGQLVRTLMIEQGCDIDRELYFSMLVDRDCQCITLIVSSEGGMDIEEVAKKTPEKVVKIAIDPLTGPKGFHVLKCAAVLGIAKEGHKALQEFITNCYRLFVEKDASLLEINPLVIDKQGTLVALDAKMSFDDNALYRHPDIMNYRDLTEEDPAEVKASEFGLSYVKLDGNIGCMVNGAGLAMATMDIIKYHGGSPANFLDVGGGATFDVVNEAFQIILADTDVEGVLVNIFGGIMKCDIIAEAIVAVGSKINLTVPVVVRLEGTNVEQGKKILNNSSLPLLTAHSLDEAAQKIVHAVQKGGQ
jgi:succinyl-CoA synthetase beta subunit